MGFQSGLSSSWTQCDSHDTCVETGHGLDKVNHSTKSCAFLLQSVLKREQEAERESLALVELLGVPQGIHVYTMACCNKLQ